MIIYIHALEALKINTNFQYSKYPDMKQRAQQTRLGKSYKTFLKLSNDTAS